MTNKPFPPMSAEDAIRQRAEAWTVVTKVLDEVSPGWNDLSETGRQSAEMAIRALAAQGGITEGWKLVPVEPTPEMLSAGESEFRSYCLRHMFGHPAVWSAMVNAAPSPETSAVQKWPVSRDPLTQMQVAAVILERDADADKPHTT